MAISVERATSQVGRSGRAIVRPVVSKEHGAWAMLLVPFAIGLGVAAQGYGRATIFLALILSFHLARYPLSLEVSKASPPGLKNRLSRGMGVMVYHLLALIAVALLSYFKSIPPLLSVAFLPGAVKAFKGTLEGRSEMKIKTVGFIEVAYSTVFAAMVIWAYRVG